MRALRRSSKTLAPRLPPSLHILKPLCSSPASALPPPDDSINADESPIDASVPRSSAPPPEGPFDAPSISSPKALIELLLRNQRRPREALNFFKRAHFQEGGGGGSPDVDPLCIMLHILVRAGHRRNARELLKRSILRDYLPRPSVVVDRLVEASERNGFLKTKRTGDGQMWWWRSGASAQAGRVAAAPGEGSVAHWLHHQPSYLA